MKRLVLLGVLVLVQGVATASPVLLFSLDPSSPSTSSTLTPADILSAGPTVVAPGSTLGLQTGFPLGAYDNLDALSFGQDPISTSLIFGVDRTSVGLAGTGVNADVTANGSAASDLFSSSAQGGNSLYLPGTSLGLTPGLFGDAIDAVEVRGPSGPGATTYFGIDRFSASNGYGSGTLASDILQSTGNGLFSVFATAASMGLNSADAISSLVLNIGPDGDSALFTLDAYSPDTFTGSGNTYQAGVAGSLSSADVLYTNFDGSFSLFASAASLGLAPTDAIDALATLPEPSGVVLLVTGLSVVGLWTHRARLSLRRRA
jgi:hypothetical protein